MERVIGRAVEKRKEMDAEREKEGENYVELSTEERMGPGGLDPIEVLDSLPEVSRIHSYTLDCVVASPPVSPLESSTGAHVVYVVHALCLLNILSSLMQEMQEAFTNRDTEALKVALSNMPNEEAQAHIKRCVDSGLWVPGGNSKDEEDE